MNTDSNPGSSPTAKSFPAKGQSWAALEPVMQGFRDRDVDWRNSRTGLYVFHAGDDVLEVGAKAYEMYHVENGLGLKTAFPSLNRMYGDVIANGLDLFGATGCGGDMSSGGTESIFLAVKTCRDFSAAAGKTLQGASIVAPFSAHPAFDKAAHYLGLEVIRVPVGEDHRADLAAMTAAVDERTIMLVGSAPCYPFGVIDPIRELGALAQSNNLWLHVDACVGGYFLPFLRAAGHEVAAFDFSVPGVRSISADLHKYGFAPKAASTVFYRDAAEHQFQQYAFNAWPCGEMTTPTASGSRPGGAIAGAWAVQHYLGRDGYIERAKQVVEAQRLIVAGAKNAGLTALHDDALPILALATPTGQMGAIWSGLRKQGWYLGGVQAPEALHMMVQPNHLRVAQDLVSALEVATKEAAKRAGADGASKETGGGPRYA